MESVFKIARPDFMKVQVISAYPVKLHALNVTLVLNFVRYVTLTMLPHSLILYPFNALKSAQRELTRTLRSANASPVSLLATHAHQQTPVFNVTTQILTISKQFSSQKRASAMKNALNTQSRAQITFA